MSRHGTGHRIGDLGDGSILLLGDEATWQTLLGGGSGDKSTDRLGLRISSNASSVRNSAGGSTHHVLRLHRRGLYVTKYRNYSDFVFGHSSTKNPERQNYFSGIQNVKLSQECKRSIVSLAHGKITKQHRLRAKLVTSLDSQFIHPVDMCPTCSWLEKHFSTFYHFCCRLPIASVVSLCQKSTIAPLSHVSGSNLCPVHVMFFRNPSLDDWKDPTILWDILSSFPQMSDSVKSSESKFFLRCSKHIDCLVHSNLVHGWCALYYICWMWSAVELLRSIISSC